jgi:hypothetical protein
MGIQIQDGTLCPGLDVRADPRKTIASEKSQTIAYHTEMIKAVILLLPYYLAQQPLEFSLLQ